VPAFGLRAGKGRAGRHSAALMSERIAYYSRRRAAQTVPWSIADVFASKAQPPTSAARPIKKL